MGRPTSQTADAEDKILRALEDGATRKAACEAADIVENTLAAWMRRDLGFKERVDEAELAAREERSRLSRLAGEAQSAAPVDTGTGWGPPVAQVLDPREQRTATSTAVTERPGSTVMTTTAAETFEQWAAQKDAGAAVVPAPVTTTGPSLRDRLREAQVLQDEERARQARIAEIPGIERDLKFQRGQEERTGSRAYHMAEAQNHIAVGASELASFSSIIRRWILGEKAIAFFDLLESLKKITMAQQSARQHIASANAIDQTEELSRLIHGGMDQRRAILEVGARYGDGRVDGLLRNLGGDFDLSAGLKQEGPRRLLSWMREQVR